MYNIDKYPMNVTRFADMIRLSQSCSLKNILAKIWMTHVHSSNELKAKTLLW
eukprot:UN02727